MRQIKFRVWDITEKEMIYPDLYWFEEEGIREVPGDAYGYQVMQFTNFKDKNGKEIWEGDIIKHPPYWHDDREVHAVKDIHMFCGDYGNYGDIETEIEVIGNIYEHSELLQQQGGKP